MNANNIGSFVEKSLTDLFDFCKMDRVNENGLLRIDVSLVGIFNQKKFMLSKCKFINDLIDNFESIYLIGDEDDFGIKARSGLVKKESQEVFKFLRPLDVSEYEKSLYMGGWALMVNKSFKNLDEIFKLLDGNEFFMSKFLDSKSELVVLSGYDDDSWTFFTKL